MGFSFYRSKKIGPFKINASSSGIGFSFGVKGARINFSPRGTFVNIGSNGIYYRKRISGNSKERVSEQTNPIEVDYLSTDDDREIGTVNFSGLTDIDSKDLVREIEKKRRRISFLQWIGLPSVIIALSILSAKEEQRIPKEESYQIKIAEVISRGANIRKGSNNNSEILFVAKRGDKFIVDSIQGNWVSIDSNSPDSIYGFIHNSLLVLRDSMIVNQVFEKKLIPKDNSKTLILLIPGLLIWCIFLAFLDKRRKSVELYYAFDDLTEELYNDLISGFINLKKTKRIWHYTYTTTTQNSKYHAGASHLVSRKKIKSIAVDRKPVSYFKTNIKMPSVILGNLELYFMPERVLFKKGRKFAAVMYKNLEITRKDTRFIENESVPKDAKIVDHTYKYVNKSGGPDGRFKDNHQIPVCLYSEYTFHSEDGVDEVIVTSSLGAMDHLEDVVSKIKTFENSLEFV